MIVETINKKIKWNLFVKTKQKKNISNLNGVRKIKLCLQIFLNQRFT